MPSLAEVLAAWLPRQRWFAAKGVGLERIGIASRNRLADDLAGAAIDHVVVEVVSPLGTQYYQLFVALEQPAGSAADQHWLIGDAEGLTATDALHHPAVTAELIRRLATDEPWGDIRLVPEPGARIDTETPGRVLTGEQSNTSVVYGNGILKVYRRLEPGVNPDVEIHRALHHAGNFHVARPLGVMAGEIGGEPTTLGFLSGFFAGAQDGWVMATGSVRQRMGTGMDNSAGNPDFAGEAQRLGAAVAEVHRDLVSELGTVELSADAWTHVVDSMVVEAQRVASYVPSIAELLPAITAAFDRARSLSAPAVLQRVHGDLHLGQTLRTPTGWAVIDFEGEPARSLPERKGRYLAAKDIAGMLRSFDYAANHLRPAGRTTPEQVAAAEDWAAGSRAAFLRGYRAALGDGALSPPEVISAFELDKAVYEVAYEYSNRPSWEPIPLHAVQTLISDPHPAEE